MSYGRFVTYNVVGGIVWIGLFVFAGFYFGNIPAVEHNFTLVIMAIIAKAVGIDAMRIWPARPCFSAASFTGDG